MVHQDLPLLTGEPVLSELSLDRPLDLVFASPSLAYVVEQKRARIQVFRMNGNRAEDIAEFLDLSAVVGGRNNEEGLLAMTLDPAFAENGLFYVYYTTARPRTVVIARYQLLDGDQRRADPESAQVLLTIDQPWGNHNGGALVFGPDGMLYVGVGDGGSAGDPQGHGQNRGTLLGSILRLQVTGDQLSENEAYKIPPDNPFVGDDQARPEIWAYGLRNPWRMSFDRETKQLWVADVGQNKLEEVNIVDRGGNYGWNVMEGSQVFRGRPTRMMIPPVFEYPHDMAVGGRSITGGFVYRGQAIPALRGAYVCADFVSGRMWALRREGRETRSRVVAEGQGPIASFAEDPSGELYLVDHRGAIRRLIAAQP